MTNILKNKRYSLLGYPGPAGMNAYQLAVLNGFTGTEAEWLASLKGEDGTAGGSGGAWVVTTKSGSDIQITSGSTNTLYYGNFITTAQPVGNYLTTAAQSIHTHDYQSTGNYLTTAMVSNAGSLFQSTGAYLTTAAQSIHTHDYQSTGAYLTTAMASNAGSLFQSTGAYLTTAAVSNHTHSDLYQSTGAYLTTAMQSASSSVFAKTGFTSSSITGTDIKVTHNTDGLSVLVPNYLTVAAGAGDGVNIIAAGGSTAASTGTYVFSNSNGISFSLNGSTITASHNALTTAAASDHTHSNLYQSTGAYLTTAMASNAGSNFQSTGAYLTTAMASGAGTNFVGLGAYTTASTAGSDLKITVTSAGLNFGIPKWLTTAMASENTSLYQGTGAYLTTAAQSGHTHGAGATASTAGSDLLFTSASNSWQLGVPKWLTTAALSANTSTQAGTGFASSSQAGAVLSATHNTSNPGLSMLIPAWITTAAVSDHTHSNLYIALGNSTQSVGLNTSSSSTSGVALKFSLNSSGATFSVPAWISTAAASDHTHSNLYIPLANSTNSVGLNTSSSSTSGVDLKFSMNSSGITFSVPAWITTGGAGGGVAIANTATTYTSGSVIFRGNNATINTSINGASQYIDVSVAAAGAGVVSLSAGTLSGTRDNIVFSNSNSVSFGMSGSTITASVPVGTVNFSDAGGITWSSSAGTGASSVSTSIYVGSMVAGGGGVAIAGSDASTMTGGTMQFVNANGVSFGLNSNTMTASIRANQIMSRVEPVPYAGVTRSVDATSRTWWMYPFVVPQDLSFDICRILITHAAPGAATTQGTTANRTHGATVSDIRYAVIYSQGAAGGANSRSLQYVTSGQASILQQWGVSMNSNGSEQSQSTYVHYPSDLGTAYLTISQSRETTVTNISINASWSNNYSGYKYMDIPFGAASLSAGNYWIGFGGSKASATDGTGATRLLSISANGGTQVGISGANIAIGQWGQLTNATNNSWTHGAAIFTTNVQGTTNSIGFTAMSSMGSHNLPYFVLMASR